MQTVFTEPGQRSFRDLSLLERRHRQLWYAVRKPPTGFYLDKDQALIRRIAGDYINFAPLAAKVTLHNQVAMRCDKMCGNLFAQFTGPLVAGGCGGRGGRFGENAFKKVQLDALCIDAFRCAALSTSGFAVAAITFLKSSLVPAHSTRST